MKKLTILLSIILLSLGATSNSFAQESTDTEEDISVTATTDTDSGAEKDNSFLYFVIIVGVVGILAAIYIAAYKGIQAGEMQVITGKIDIALIVLSFIATGSGFFYSTSESPVTTNIVLFYVAGAVCGLASLSLTVVKNIKLECSLGQHILAIAAKLIVICLAILAIFAFFFTQVQK